MALTLRLQPFPLQLSETRRMEVSIRIRNSSSHFMQLEFPTSQRIEVLMRDDRGQTVQQWSEDQAFEPVGGWVGINPGELVEYTAALSTRDLQPGKRYTVTAFLPIRNDLQAELSFTPGR